MFALDAYSSQTFNEPPGDSTAFLKCLQLWNHAGFVKFDFFRLLESFVPFVISAAIYLAFLIGVSWSISILIINQLSKTSFFLDELQSVLLYLNTSVKNQNSFFFPFFLQKFSGIPETFFLFVRNFFNTPGKAMVRFAHRIFSFSFLSTVVL